jgi:uncharacterized protein with HEPN domain
MRHEELYLADIIEAADSISMFIQDIARSEFVGNDLVRSAVLQKLLIIGEAAARLPKDFKEQYPEIPWADIVAFRNFAIHAYFSVDWGIVWVAATKDAPTLRQMVADILTLPYSRT